MSRSINTELSAGYELYINASDGRNNAAYRTLSVRITGNSRRVLSLFLLSVYFLPVRKQKLKVFVGFAKIVLNQNQLPP